jgi:hypothetical protein
MKSNNNLGKKLNQTLTNMNNNIRDKVQNQLVVNTLRVLLIIYTAFVVPMLKVEHLNVVNQQVVRFILVAIIIYLSFIDLPSAILLTIAFLVTLQSIKKEPKEPASNSQIKDVSLNALIRNLNNNVTKENKENKEKNNSNKPANHAVINDNSVEGFESNNSAPAPAPADNLSNVVAANAILNNNAAPAVEEVANNAAPAVEEVANNAAPAPAMKEVANNAAPAPAMKEVANNAAPAPAMIEVANNAAPAPAMKEVEGVMDNTLTGSTLNNSGNNVNITAEAMKQDANTINNSSNITGESIPMAHDNTPVNNLSVFDSNNAAVKNTNLDVDNMAGNNKLIDMVNSEQPAVETLTESIQRAQKNNKGPVGFTTNENLYDISENSVPGADIMDQVRSVKGQHSAQSLGQPMGVGSIRHKGYHMKDDRHPNLHHHSVRNENL